MKRLAVAALFLAATFAAGSSKAQITGNVKLTVFFKTLDVMKSDPNYHIGVGLHDLAQGLHVYVDGKSVGALPMEQYRSYSISNNSRIVEIRYLSAYWIFGVKRQRTGNSVDVSKHLAGGSVHVRCEQQWLGVKCFIV